MATLHSTKPFKSTTELRQHEAAVDPFVQWRKGNRAQLVSSVSQSLRSAAAAAGKSDVSHLTDAPIFQIGRVEQQVPTIVTIESPPAEVAKPSSPNTASAAMLFDTVARQERVRRRALGNAPVQIVERFQDIGPCAVPGAVIRLMQEASESGPLSQRGPAIPDSWMPDRGVTSFERTKPPSRADAMAVGRAMQLMHRIVDDVYTAEEAQAASGLTLSVSVKSAESLRSLLPEPKLPGGLSSVLQGLETQWVLEHLAVVDIGFAELIRQVKVQCVERGSLLNYVRETLFDYLADFLGSERGREQQIAIKEEELRSASAKFDETCTALEAAQQTIVELETEVHRLETLQKYTIAKHIRDKQRLTRRHEHRKAGSGGGSVSGGRRRSGSDSQDAHDDNEDSMSDDDDDDTLAQLVRQKREQEPKVRRQSMANPMVVPNSMQHVRQRARIRVAESMDAAVMTDPVFIRSKATVEDLKLDTPPPPPPVARPPRRERLASVSIARSVTHNYSQTDPPTPAQQLLSRTTSDAAAVYPGNGDGGNAPLEPTVPLTRRPSIMNSAAVPRVTTEEIRRRISVAKTKPARLAAVNAAVQATASTSEASVQNVVSTTAAGTQFSVLLQMHVGGLMQSTPLQQPLMLPEVTTSGVHSEDSLGKVSDKVRRQTSPTPGGAASRSRSPSEGVLSRVRSPMQSRVSPRRTSPTEGSPVHLGDSTSARLGNSARPAPSSPGKQSASKTASKSPSSSKASSSTTTLPPLHGKPTSSSTRDAPGTGTAGVARVPLSTQGTQTSITLTEPLPTRATAPPPSTVAIASKFIETASNSTHKVSNAPPKARLAGLVKPLIEGDLSGAPSSSVYALSSTKTPGQRFRNLKWMLGSVSEVFASATAAKFGSGGDASTLLVKHFRTKYGFEKVADGYAKDFITTLDAMLSNGSAMPGDGGDASLGSIGRYPMHDDTESITIHRRMFAYLQFCVVNAGQPCEGLDKDAAYHGKSFQFYLHILDALRTKGGKGLAKDLGDAMSVRLSPKFILTTLEASLKDHFPRLALELFLLAVQGAMLQEVPTDTKAVPALALPSLHATLQDPDYVELMPFAQPSIPTTLDVDAPGTWDLDVLLETLVRGYDTVVRSLIFVGQRTEARLIHPNGPVMTTVVVWNGGP